jgi:hypothetical protein
VREVKGEGGQGEPPSLIRLQTKRAAGAGLHVYACRLCACVPLGRGCMCRGFVCAAGAGQAPVTDGLHVLQAIRDRREGDGLHAGLAGGN